MLLTNPSYSMLDLYIKNINNQLADENEFIITYKSYEKEVEDKINYICWDIKTDIQTENHVLLNRLDYFGTLKFYYNKVTGEITIEELPYYLMKTQKIYIFTNDIAKLIEKNIKKMINTSNINIKFSNPLFLFAIDNKLEKIFPKILNTPNYQLIKKIIDQIAKEEEKIKEEVLQEKQKKDARERKIERAISKKRKIYGIDSKDYENYFEYLKDVNKKICEVCEYKINNIKRHIEANKKIYIELLRKNDKGHKGTKEFLDSYYEKIYQHDSDLSDKKSLISLLTQIRKERLWTDPRYDEKYKCHAKPNDIYDSVIGVKEYVGWESEEVVNYNNPIFNGPRIVQKDFRKCMDVLLQIASLKKQLAHYESIKSNPDKALLSFQKNKDSWNSIISFPYWMRLSRDLYRSNEEAREKIYLLMIKPGVKNINLEKVKLFTVNNGKEFGIKSKNSNRYDNFCKEVIENRNLKCNRLIMTIPSSLELKSLINILDFAHKYGKNLLFICENSDIAATVKNILVTRALSAIKKGEVYLKYNCFINVDPNYFQVFFINTPSNKMFWHQYDFTSNYSFRRKEKSSLTIQIDQCLLNNFKTHNGKIIYKEVEEQLLGNYNSALEFNDFQIKENKHWQELQEDAYYSYYPTIFKIRKEKEKKIRDNADWVKRATRKTLKFLFEESSLTTQEAEELENKISELSIALEGKDLVDIKKKTKILKKAVQDFKFREIATKKINCVNHLLNPFFDEVITNEESENLKNALNELNKALADKNKAEINKQSERIELIRDKIWSDYKFMQVVKENTPPDILFDAWKNNEISFEQLDKKLCITESLEEQALFEREYEEYQRVIKL